MSSLRTTILVTAGYETADAQGGHPNWQINTLFYKEVLCPRWGLPTPLVFSRLCKTGSLNRAARKRENVLRFGYGHVYAHDDAQAVGLLCQLALRHPDVRLSLFFDYKRQDDQGNYVLGWIEITCESEFPEVQQELSTWLYESISVLARMNGIHFHNEEENLSATVTITVSEQQACYRSWHDEEGRGPAGAFSGGDEVSPPAIGEGSGI